MYQGRHVSWDASGLYVHEAARWLYSKAEIRAWIKKVYVKTTTSSSCWLELFTLELSLNASRCSAKFGRSSCVRVQLYDADLTLLKTPKKDGTGDLMVNIVAEGSSPRVENSKAYSVSVASLCFLADPKNSEFKPFVRKLRTIFLLFCAKRSAAFSDTHLTLELYHQPSISLFLRTLSEAGPDVALGKDCRTLGRRRTSDQVKQPVAQADVARVGRLVEGTL